MVTGLHFPFVCEINPGDRHHSHLTGRRQMGRSQIRGQKVTKDWEWQSHSHHLTLVSSCYILTPLTERNHRMLPVKSYKCWEAAWNSRIDMLSRCADIIWRPDEWLAHICAAIITQRDALAVSYKFTLDATYSLYPYIYSKTKSN